MFGLNYLHKNNIIHRDIKCLNLFISKENVIKIGDMGVSKIVSSLSALNCSKVGTPLFLAPELIKQVPYDYKVDLWSFGCAMYHLAALEPPFIGENVIILGNNILKTNPRKFNSVYSNEFNNLIFNKLLNKKSDKRPCSKEAIKYIPNKFIESYYEKIKTISKNKYKSNLESLEGLDLILCKNDIKLNKQLSSKNINLKAENKENFSDSLILSNKINSNLSNNDNLNNFDYITNSKKNNTKALYETNTIKNTKSIINNNINNKINDNKVSNLCNLNFLKELNKDNSVLVKVKNKLSSQSTLNNDNTKQNLKIIEKSESMNKNNLILNNNILLKKKSSPVKILEDVSDNKIIHCNVNKGESYNNNNYAVSNKYNRPNTALNKYYKNITYKCNNELKRENNLTSKDNNNNNNNNNINYFKIPRPFTATFKPNMNNRLASAKNLKYVGNENTLINNAKNDNNIINININLYNINLDNKCTNNKLINPINCNNNLIYYNKDLKTVNKANYQNNMKLETANIENIVKNNDIINYNIKSNNRQLSNNNNNNNNNIYNKKRPLSSLTQNRNLKIPILNNNNIINVSNKNKISKKQFFKENNNKNYNTFKSFKDILNDFDYIKENKSNKITINEFFS